MSGPAQLVQSASSTPTGRIGSGSAPSPTRSPRLVAERQAEPTAADLRLAARAAWRAEPSLTGSALAVRFGRQARWGRDQIAAARREDAAGSRPGTAVAADGMPPAPTGMPDRQDGMPLTRPAVDPATTHRPATATTEASSPAVPRPLLAMTVGSVGLVTVVCAVVSYNHARHLAELSGQGDLAPWLPLAVDGLVTAATCSLLVDRRLGESGHPLAWLGVAIGLAGSLGANLVAVDPALVDVRHVRWVMAAYVPAALAIAGHLLMRMLGDHRPPPVPEGRP